MLAKKCSVAEQVKVANCKQKAQTTPLGAQYQEGGGREREGGELESLRERVTLARR